MRIYLLLKVSSVLFINQNQIEEVAYRELLIDIPHGWCQIISCDKLETVMGYRPDFSLFGVLVS